MAAGRSPKIVRIKADRSVFLWEKDDIYWPGRVAFVRLEERDVVVGERYGDRSVESRCHPADFIDGCFQATIQETFDAATLAEVIAEVKAQAVGLTPRRPADRPELVWADRQRAAEAAASAARAAKAAKAIEPAAQAAAKAAAPPAASAPDATVKPAHQDSAPDATVKVAKKAAMAASKPATAASKPAPVEAAAPPPEAQAAPPIVRRKAARATPARALSALAPAPAEGRANVALTSSRAIDLALMMALKSITGEDTGTLKSRLEDLPMLLKANATLPEAQAIKKRLGALGAIVKWHA